MNEAQIVQTDFDGLLANCGSIDAVSWKAPQGMDFVRWAEIGQKFQLMSGSLNWWIGDWLNEGERRYGETYTQAIELTGHKLEYLKNCKWVSSVVRTSTRVDVLTWTHHRYVAHLPEKEQKLWLKHAADNGLSSAALKQALEDANAERKKLPESKLDWMEDESIGFIQVSSDESEPESTLTAASSSGNGNAHCELTTAQQAPPVAVSAQEAITGVWIRNDDTPEQVYDKVTQIFPAEWTVRFYQLVSKGAIDNEL